jgi:N-acetylglucosaminyl-diphospho-decaprenol L-rhamnosyltransferase
MCALVLAIMSGALAVFRQHVAFIIPCRGACSGLGFTGVVPNENLLGIVLAASIPFVYLGFRGWTRIWFVVYLAGIAIATGSRTAVGASVITLLVLLIVRPSLETDRLGVGRKLLAWSTLAGAIAVSVLISRIPEDTSALTGRPQLWAVASSYIARSPWFGYGPARWEQLSETSEIPHAALRTSHNIWLDVFFVAGGVGAAFFIGGLVAVIVASGRARTGVVIALATIFMIGTTEGIWSIASFDFASFTFVTMLLMGAARTPLVRSPAQETEVVSAPTDITPQLEPSFPSATTRTAPAVDVVIVNWNTGPFLRECLSAIAASSQTHFRFGKVVIVDNASTDDSLDGAIASPLPVSIVRNAENRGFAAACNQGARAGNGDFLLFLNPDTRVATDAVDRSVAFMIDPVNRDIGICGGHVIGESGEEEFSASRFPTLGMLFAKMTGLAYLFPRWFPEQRVASEEIRESGVVDQVIGAYFLIRRPLFESLGGFDERFFVYLEDVDLAYRSRQLGHPSYLLREARVYHAGHVSSDQVRGKRLFYLLRGRTEYANKHWPSWQAPVLGALTLGVELPVRWALAARRGGRDEMKEVGEATRRYAAYCVAAGRARLSGSRPPDRRGDPDG